MSNLNHNSRSVWKKWLIDSKLYHLPIWILYEVLSNLAFSTDTFSWTWQNFSITSFYLISHVVGSYFNIYYLIPKFLKNGKYLIYCILLFLNLLISPLIIILGFAITFQFDETVLRMFLSDQAVWAGTIYGSGISTIVYVMILKLVKEWIISQNRAKELEKEKLETELKFLKAQFNPHFLFNTINSIFFLIHKNQDQASDSLAKFSEMLRYQLYECNEAKIPLQKEIAYLENYIELEMLRQESDLNIAFDSKIRPENNEGTPVEIAPFVLMPFVENAFKHALKDSEGNYFIEIRLKKEKDILCFEVSNSINLQTAKSEEAVKYGGIGLENVRRRLDLVYPNRHKFEIEEKQNSFVSKLEIELN
ncbi:MAG: two-component system LytT family sensor kinase [Bacteroidia bacterium]|jgi:two-component system LytT family sensor kinase